MLQIMCVVHYPGEKKLLMFKILLTKSRAWSLPLGGKLPRYGRQVPLEMTSVGIGLKYNTKYISPTGEADLDEHLLKKWKANIYFLCSLFALIFQFDV